MKSKKKSGKDEVNVARKKVDDDDSEYSLRDSTVDYSAYEWIFDSGYSFQICRKGNCFLILANGGIVWLGNGSCLIHGIGNVKMRLSNGMA